MVISKYVNRILQSQSWSNQCRVFHNMKETIFKQTSQNWESRSKYKSLYRQDSFWHTLDADGTNKETFYQTRASHWPDSRSRSNKLSIIRHAEEKKAERAELKCPNIIM